MRCGLVLALMTVLALPIPAQPMEVGSVRTFAVQIQNLDSRSAIEKLARSNFDMLIIDDLHQARGGESVNMRDIVATLRKAKANRLILAYVDLGAAESDRWYWQKNWKAPAGRTRGTPDFLMMENPSGWEDTYPVAFWDDRWRRFAVGDQGIVQRAMADGFDGIFVDWVEGHAQAAIAAEAAKQQINPADAMLALLSDARKSALAANPKAKLLTLNGDSLADKPRFAEVIDGIVAESLWFAGKGDVPWSSNAGGDIPAGGTENRITALRGLSKAGKPVFTMDYCLKPENARAAERQSRQLGFVPSITRSCLGGLPEAP